MNKATQKLLRAQASKALARALGDEQPSAYDLLLKRAMVDQMTTPEMLTPQAAA